MSLNGFEFISPEEITVKCEINKEVVKYDHHTINIQPDNYKCGEIFTSNCYDFYLVCVDCGGSYINTVEFGDHFRTNHQKLNGPEICVPTVKSEPKFGIECIEDDEECRKSERLTGNKKQPAMFKRRKRKNLRKSTHLTEYICQFCGKEYRYRQSFEKHDCQSVCEKDELPPLDVSCEFSNPSSAFDEPLKSSSLESPVSEQSAIKLLNQSEIASVSSANAIAESNQSEQIDAKEGDLYTNRKDKVSKKTGSGKPIFFCEICRRQFKYKIVFRKHGMQHEEAPLELKKDPTYRKCLYCDITFTNNTEWFRHETEHSRTGSFSCSKCLKKFKTEIELEAHSRKHTEKKRVTCEQCGAHFGTTGNLLAHQNRVHLKLKPFPCEICDKTFVRKVDVQAHMRRHTGEKIYQCDECGRSFMTSTLLKDHKKSKHTNIRDVQCPFCPMTFFTNGMMKKHIVKHSSERPYICKTCGNTFSRSKALSAHKKIHMDTKQYVCNLCGKAFAQHAGLYMHKKTHLNGGEM